MLPRRTVGIRAQGEPWASRALCAGLGPKAEQARRLLLVEPSFQARGKDSPWPSRFSPAGAHWPALVGVSGGLGRLLFRRFGYPRDKDRVSIKSFIAGKWARKPVTTLRITSSKHENILLYLDR